MAVAGDDLDKIVASAERMRPPHHRWPKRAAAVRGQDLVADMNLLDRPQAAVGHRHRRAGGQALIVITDREHRSGIAGQHPQPGVLQRVGVLEFVDQDVPEALAVVLLDLRHVAAQLVGAQQQFGEVDQPVLGALRFVGGIDAHQRALREIALIGHAGGPPAFFLLRVDPAGDDFRHPLLFGQIQRADHPLDQPLLVVGIKDLEVLDQPGFLPVQPQQAMRDAVEGADPHGPHRHIDQAFDAVAHLGGGLVGEGHREDRMRRHAFHRNQPADAMGQHPGLAGAGTGQHQTVLGRCGHRFALCRVQAPAEPVDLRRITGRQMDRHVSAAPMPTAPPSSGASAGSGIPRPPKSPSRCRRRPSRHARRCLRAPARRRSAPGTPAPAS